MSKEFQIRDGNLIASFDLENEDGDIDICKLLKVSHGVADEIGMFVDYVATNKIIEDQSNQISDLEAKLAESEKKYTELFCRNIELETLYSQKTALLNFYKDTDLVKENQQLKQQLVEKEKEIKQLKLDLGMFKSVNEFLNRYGIEKAREVLLQIEKTKRQDKISFAVEQLELARRRIDRLGYNENKCLNKKDCIEDCLEEIDNQIKELKGEK